MCCSFYFLSFIYLQFYTPHRPEAVDIDFDSSSSLEEEEPRAGVEAAPEVQVLYYILLVISSDWFVSYHLFLQNSKKAVLVDYSSSADSADEEVARITASRPDGPGRLTSTPSREPGSNALSPLLFPDPEPMQTPAETTDTRPWNESECYFNGN